MNLLWSKYDISFDGEYKDKKSVHINYEVEIKNNFTFIFCTNENSLIRLINHCIQDWLSKWVEKKSMYEGQDTRRLIRDDKLSELNYHILQYFKEEWCPKGIKVKYINIKYLI